MTTLEQDEDDLAKRTARASLWTRLAIVAGVLLALGVATLQLNLTLQAARNTRDLERTAERVESCTTPGGDCYEEGNARTTEAVTAIVRGVVYAVVCASRPGTTLPQVVERCVDRLAEQDAAR